MTKVSVGIVAALSGLVLALTAAPFAVAKDGDKLVRGTCTGPSTSKLKLSNEDGRIEVEFEVDQNRNGVRWDVAIFQQREPHREDDESDEGAERLVRGAHRRRQQRGPRLVPGPRDEGVGRGVHRAGLVLTLRSRGWGL